MTSAYQPTTVQKEERDDDNATAFCNPFHGRRHHDFENERRQSREHEARSNRDRERNDGVNQWLLTRCVSRQSAQTEDGSAVHTPTGSEHHLPPSTETVPPSKLSRAQTIKKKIIKGTENFFGLGDCDEQHDHLQRKWTQRRKRHYHKRYGRLVGTPEDAVDNFPQSGKHGTMGTGSISSYQSSHPPDPDLVRTMSRRESVATMAWKKMKKIKNDPGTFKSPGRSQPVSTLLEAGRSFSPAVMSQSEGDEVDSAFPGDGGIDHRDIDDDVFFNFMSERPRRKFDKPGFLPGIQEEEKPIPAIPQEGKDEIEGPPRPPIRSTRGQRIRDRPRVTNANRREYGKGLAGRWLNRTIKRKRLTSTIKKQMESLTDHRWV